MGFYYLVYAFDKECQKSLILKQGTLEELDEFTSKFRNSQEIRKKFKKEIDYFRENNKKYIETIEKKTGVKENGDIVIHSIECGKNHEKSNKRTRVLYKYHVHLFKDLIKNKDLMIKFSKKCYYEIKNNISSDKSLMYRINEFESKIITFYESYSQKEYNYILSSWKKNLLNSGKYYSTMRVVFGLYKKLCSEKKDLRTFESLVTEYKNKYIISKSTNVRKSISGIVEITKESIEQFEEYDTYEEHLLDMFHAQDFYDVKMTREQLYEFKEEYLNFKNQKR